MHCESESGNGDGRDENIMNNSNRSGHSDGDFVDLYDTSVESLATAQEHKEYQRNLSVREQEQQELSDRLSGNVSVDSWYVLIYLWTFGLLKKVW